MGFYKYIIKRGDSYEIMKDNEKYGTYSKLTDALYERDRLIKADWDWEDALELEETENLYEKMRLPKFVHEYSYIYKRNQGYVVFKGNEYYGKFNTKRDAYEYAEQIGGKVYPTGERWIVKKTIDGLQVEFGRFKTLEEAKALKDKLVANGWKQ